MGTSYHVVAESVITQAFEWTADQGVRGLGVPGWHSASDGTTIVSERREKTNSFDDVYADVYRRVGDSFILADNIDDLPGGRKYVQVSAVSDDGKVVVGHSTGYTGSQPIRWTTDTGTESLASSPSCSAGESFDVSADGSAIVGWTNCGRSYKGFWWTEQTGRVDIPGISIGEAVSSDGLIALGWSQRDSNNEVAVIWDADHGSRDLQEVLANDFGLAQQFTDWSLSTVRGLSADRRVLWGTANNFRDFWIASLDHPLVPFRLCGDADLDQDLDSADLLTFLENWTGTLNTGVGNGTFAMDDCDADKDIDSADLLNFLEGWTGAEGSGLAQVATVPEPNFGMAPLVLALFGALKKRRRWR